MGRRDFFDFFFFDCRNNAHSPRYTVVMGEKKLTREEALELYREHQRLMPVREIARRAGVSRQALHQWFCKAEPPRAAGSGTKGGG